MSTDLDTDIMDLEAQERRERDDLCQMEREDEELMTGTPPSPTETFPGLAGQFVDRAKIEDARKAKEKLGVVPDPSTKAAEMQKKRQSAIKQAMARQREWDEANPICVLRTYSQAHRTVKCWEPIAGQKGHKDRLFFVEFTDPLTGEVVAVRIPGKDAREAMGNHDMAVQELRAEVMRRVVEARTEAYKALPWWRRMFTKKPQE